MCFPREQGAACGVIACVPSVHTSRLTRAYRLPSDAIPYISVHNLTVRIMQAVIPLWEDTAASMGLPRNFEGVARLTRAVTTSVCRPLHSCAWECMPQWECWWMTWCVASCSVIHVSWSWHGRR